MITKTQDSNRAAQAVADFGKVAEHPVCITGLALWRLDSQIAEHSKQIQELDKLRSDISEQIQQAVLCRRNGSWEPPYASVFAWGKLIDKLRKHADKSERSYRAIAMISEKLSELRPRLLALFEAEQSAATPAALKALGQVRKKWILRGKPSPETRILDALRLKSCDYRWRKSWKEKGWEGQAFADAAITGYSEVALGRPLSQYHNLYTAAELSELLGLPDHVVRGAAKRLGIQLLRARTKGKKRSAGRPREGVPLTYYGDMDIPQITELKRKIYGDAPDTKLHIEAARELEAPMQETEVDFSEPEEVGKTPVDAEADAEEKARADAEARVAELEAEDAQEGREAIKAPAPEEEEEEPANPFEAYQDLAGGVKRPARTKPLDWHPPVKPNPARTPEENQAFEERMAKNFARQRREAARYAVGRDPQQGPGTAARAEIKNSYKRKQAAKRRAEICKDLGLPSDPEEGGVPRVWDKGIWKREDKEEKS
jgi:hypothetical protein